MVRAKKPNPKRKKLPDKWPPFKCSHCGGPLDIYAVDGRKCGRPWCSLYEIVLRKGH